MGKRRAAPSRDLPQGALDPDHDDLDEHIEAISDAFEVIRTSAIPPKHSDLPALRPYLKYARVLSLTVSPFIEVKNICKPELAYLHNATDERTAPEHSEWYWQIVWNMPGPRKRFHYVLKSLWLRNNKGRGPGEDFLTMIDDAADSGRFDVTKTLKKEIVKLLPRKQGDAIVPPLVKDDEKALRGFNHVAFGELIVGIAYRSRYGRNPKAYCQGVKNGEIEHVPDHLPSFLFKHDIVYDKNNPEEGLGLGYIFTRALATILTTPSTAFGDKSKGRKSSRAFTMGWTTVPGPVAASIAVQTYIALSDMSEFGSDDGKYSLEVTFEHLVYLFTCQAPESLTLRENITESLPHLEHGPKSQMKKQENKKRYAHNPLTDILAARNAAAAARGDPPPRNNSQKMASDEEEEQLSMYDEGGEEEEVEEYEKRKRRSVSRLVSDQDEVETEDEDDDYPRKRRHTSTGSQSDDEDTGRVASLKGLRLPQRIPSPLYPSNVINSPSTPVRSRKQGKATGTKQTRKSSPKAAQPTPKTAKKATKVYSSQRRLPARTGTAASTTRLGS